ncbi:Cas10/Cmr2 second palm domain-containing protein [Allochromatium tepidum]|uniref:Cas10/Cmr2 second palm domain-containing protein n=1 Tax=Allochromatium tepidum TaxID=553982 RepID=A0ABM7QQL0_9GAMM|nr:hypothetical protein [Allochromatium tepidum]BCU08288.1 hypothetical protein Atep_29650 [Allochromatium tepidum]
MGTPTVKLTLELKRVQTFIFEVPRLKAMLGANALIGQTMRHELPALPANQGSRLDWPKEIRLQGTADDPLDRPETDASDRDDPAALYQRGILARDGGHFIVLFDDESAAERFLEQAEAVLAERLPGVLYEARIDPFPEPKEPPPRQPRDPHETALLDLPVLQVCQETGQGPASVRNDKGYWQGESVRYRLEWGDWFYKGCTQDIIGLLRPTLYPDRAMDWQEPDDLAQLAAGGYLALIHADGNGIGKRYKSWRDQAKSQNEVVKEAHGEAFFHSMRVAVRRAVVTALTKTFTEPGGVRPYEILMLGGDDLLLACRADRALDFARHYAEELTRYTLADGQPLTVAIGAAIARKSYPLHRLHELAEDLASSAKRLYRALLSTGETSSVIDWQVVTQSWFADVAEARRQTERIQYQVNGQVDTLLLTGRPYRVLGAEGLDELLRDAQQLDAPRKPGESGDTQDESKAARSSLRALRAACEQGRLMAEMAFARLPESVRARLAWNDGALWKPTAQGDQTFYLTRALDIIGLREIEHLGKRQDQSPSSSGREVEVRVHNRYF